MITLDKQVPNFLYSALPNKDDKLRTVEDMRLLMLWQHVYGSRKQFDYEIALDLQNRLRAQHEAFRLKQTQKQAELRDKQLRAYRELTTAIGELVFSVSVLGEDVKNLSEVGWHEQIQDVHTCKKWGSAHELFNGKTERSVDLGWDNLRTDARSDLSSYLVELKNRYDNFKYPFTFYRESKKRFFGVRKAPFPPEIPSTFSFTLRLRYQPFSVDEVAQKVQAQLEKARQKT